MSGGAGSCDCCAGVAFGEECVFVLLFVVVILALVGLVVSVFAGVIYANKIVQRHIHIVTKKTMAQELIVKDLAEGAFDIEAQRPSDLIELNGGNHYADEESGLLLTNSSMRDR